MSDKFLSREQKENPRNEHDKIGKFSKCGIPASSATYKRVSRINYETKPNQTINNHVMVIKHHFS